MENLPANLDVGDVYYLPSDIYPTQEHAHPNRPISQGGPYVEDHARQFNSHLNVFDYHHQHQQLFPPKPLEVFEPIAQYALTATPLNGFYGLNVGSPFDRGLVSYERPPVHISSGPLRYHMQKPVQPQTAEQMRETSIGWRSVHGQQNHPPNRPVSFQGNGFSHGPFMKNCRGSTGTGVFIPLAFNGRTAYDTGMKKTGAFQQKDPSRQTGVGKAEENYYYHQVSTSDVGLPKDWTY